ncbi:hypothetical protein O9X99_01960 [Agrobacterium salinitolerans]|uniref:Uncharacterized protein n=1 Tax=Agrobacterium salinitolerans TaxID=1183413 RepID=A0ABY3BUV8_9HYPH|nr:MULTISPECIES: hypothetical protein [Agrobacterium]MCZ7890432.1 hypothetical protein [Agrobacterium salinitolerans]TRA96846.1 hypothetical protein EXN23_00995 [Agrobacterium salinitolerans]
MYNRYIKIDASTGYVVNVTMGAVTAPGFSAVQQTPDLLHVGVGWSYSDGKFLDTRTAYRAHLAAIRDFGSQGFLASLPEA